jgi:nitrate/nitrite-specific signal transduction histidine kinase
MAINLQAIEQIGAPVVSEVWSQVIHPLLQSEEAKIGNAEIKAFVAGLDAAVSALVQAELAKLAAAAAPASA